MSAGRAVLPEDVSLPSPGRVASGVSMEDLPPEVRSALQEQGLTVEEVRSEARQVLRDVVSRQEQQAATQEVQEAAADAIRGPGDLPQDVNALIDDLFGGPGAVLSEEDRQEALATLEERLGVSPEEAEAFLASAEERAQEAAAQVEQSVEAARQQATEAAQAASSAVSTAALLLSVASTWASPRRSAAAMWAGPRTSWATDPPTTPEGLRPARRPERGRAGRGHRTVRASGPLF